MKWKSTYVLASHQKKNLFPFCKNPLDTFLKPKAQSSKKTSKATCIFTLGKKLRFSVSTMFQLHFEVENVNSNYKMFFSTQNDGFNFLPK
jgi:hypothetical protein